MHIREQVRAGHRSGHQWIPSRAQRARFTRARLALRFSKLGGLAPILLAFVLIPSSFGQSGSDPDLSGSWVDQSNSADQLVLAEKGDKIQVRELDGAKVLADYTCNLNGAQCQIKEEGRPVNVMIYYNGSKLVEIKERGSDVEKRRFTLGDDGKTLLVESIPLSGEGKTVRHTYQKQNSQVAKSTT